MKLKLMLLGACASLAGCATAYESVSYVPSYEARNVMFVPAPIYSRAERPCRSEYRQQVLAEEQIRVAQYNEHLSGLYGPNRYSAALLEYQNRNREARAIEQNPWHGYFIQRNVNRLY